jgi:hypothetical protein
MVPQARWKLVRNGPLRAGSCDRTESGQVEQRLVFQYSLPAEHTRVYVMSMGTRGLLAHLSASDRLVTRQALPLIATVLGNHSNAGPTWRMSGGPLHPRMDYNSGSSRHDRCPRSRHISRRSPKRSRPLMSEFRSPRTVANTSSSSLLKTWSRSRRHWSFWLITRLRSAPDARTKRSRKGTF